MSKTPQRRPYVSRTAAFSNGADSPMQVLEECMAEIDRREAARLHRDRRRSGPRRSRSLGGTLAG